MRWVTYDSFKAKLGKRSRISDMSRESRPDIYLIMAKKKQKIKENAGCRWSSPEGRAKNAPLRTLFRAILPAFVVRIKHFVSFFFTELAVYNFVSPAAAAAVTRDWRIGIAEILNCETVTSCCATERFSANNIIGYLFLASRRFPFPFSSRS